MEIFTQGYDISCSPELSDENKTTTNTTTTNTIITTMNESIDNHSDEVNTTMEDPHFFTENPDFIDSHIVQLSLSDSYNTLPDIDTNYLKTKENQDADLNVSVSSTSLTKEIKK